MFQPVRTENPKSFYKIYYHEIFIVALRELVTKGYINAKKNNVYHGIDPICGDPYKVFL